MTWRDVLRHCAQLKSSVMTPDGTCYLVSTVPLPIVLPAVDELLEGARFETMVFAVGFKDHYCARYATAKEAVTGHFATCAALRAGTLELY